MRNGIVAIAIAFVASGCDQLAATVSGASVLTRTPDLANAENMPAELYAALNLGSLGIKPGVAVVVAAGERESTTSTAAPTPITGATVQIGWVNQRVSLCEVTAAGGEGTYEATNVAGQDCFRDLEYSENETYLTEVETGTDLYTLSVTAPGTLAAANVQFTPALNAPTDQYGVMLPEHSGGRLTLDWSGAAAAADRHVFVTLGRVRYVGGDGVGDALLATSWQADSQLVWDNFPSSANDIIGLMLDAPDTSVTIDAGAFSEKGLYVLVVTPTDLSDNVSTNLFLGSSALAGAGTAFVFWVD